MVRTQIQLEEEDFERLKREAARCSCSVSAFVRDSIKAALIESERRSTAEDVMKLAGKYDSSLSDLSENHDKYLEDGW
jgi:predicted DNA-binding protein